MASISTHLLKTKSDATHAAFNEWWDAGQDVARLRLSAEIDREAIERAEQKAFFAGQRYDLMARDVAITLRDLIGRAEHEETVAAEA